MSNTRNTRTYLTKSDCELLNVILEKESKFHMIGSNRWRHITRIQEKIETIKNKQDDR